MTALLKPRHPGYLLFVLFLFFAAISHAHAAGTINLSLDRTAYCATSQSGNDFTGVSGGSCGVTPPPAPGRYTFGSVVYGTNGPQVTADLTKWLWLKGSATNPPSAWPGVNGAHVQIVAIPKNSYVALEFKTDSVKRSGMFSTIPDNRVPKYDICITKAPGLFMSPAGNTGACRRGVLADGSVSITWRLGMANAPDFAAMLEPNTTYYVNIWFSSPATIGSASAPIKLTHNYQ